MNLSVGLNAPCMPAASLVTKTKCDLWRQMKTINGIFARVVYVLDACRRSALWSSQTQPNCVKSAAVLPFSLHPKTEFSLMKSSILVSALFCGAITSSLSAAIVSYTDLGFWSEDVVASGASVATETFNTYQGFYAGSITGNTGGIAWTATSPGALALLGLAGLVSRKRR